MRIHFKNYCDRIVLIVILIIFASIFSFIAIQSHNHFETFGWDLGFFDQIIWKASQGDLIAYSTIAKENLLADHFQIVLYFLAPLYWMRSDVRLILVAQAFLVVFAAYPIYLLSKRVTKHLAFSFSIVLAYLLFLGTQWTILNEFHQTAFAPLFLSIAFYFLQQRKPLGFILGITGLLITKEELGLLVATLGPVVWLHFKMKRLGLVTIFIGILSFFLLIYLIMPSLSVRGTYSHFDLGEAGYTPIDVIKRELTEPIFIVKSMVYPSIKLRTIFDSFLAFGFLPLTQLILLMPILGNFFTRFIYAGPQFTKWVNVNHHAAPLGPLLAVASIYSGVLLVKYMYKKVNYPVKQTWFILAIYVSGFALFQNLLLHGPINSIFKPQLYHDEGWMEDTREAITHIPINAPVAAQNNLVPHLSQRDKIYLLPEIHDAQYIAVDFHDGPNAYSPIKKKELKEVIDNLIDSKSFTLAFQKGEAMILRKI